MGGNESRENSKQEGRGENNDVASSSGLTKGAVAAGAIAAGLAAVAFGVASLLPDSSSSEGERKTMKAPGRNNERIYRDDFERDPASYFKNSRQSKN